MGRANFITHRDRRILHIDFTNCSPEEFRAGMTETQQTIAAEPLGSVLTFTDFTGLRIDSGISAQLSAYAKANKPYVRAAALLGIEGINRLLLSGVALFSKRDLRVFDSREDALEWLSGMQ